ncbi:type II toxin-antitoxin system VapC family toxin (plasmid) [Polymorphobacter sp. PAMC 29334]|uniref:type II toxin-antitoxin system VapC family toxin n=1 Tax=Polymorphobacter sp. PAMC 29334 TaxID=2862331 RepID=UPI001C68054F|nr:type II toxin-antitoxin system VapC family toxin [Polymorphobacter sp. PAMC 29334]QYE37168.1 type II toxin-antitoxin system VapC family toxin [Polymorphobacter sp. PAMC 29334]
MTRVAALLDSNVVIAMVAEEHEHHAASAALLADGPDRRLAVAAHSYAEAYATLTRRHANALFRWSAEEAWATLESVAAATTLVGLSPAQTFDTIRSYAAAGGIGPRLYDRLIGQVAVQNGLGSIVTWNVGHLRDLFPGLRVDNPKAAVAWEHARDAGDRS